MATTLFVFIFQLGSYFCLGLVSSFYFHLPRTRDYRRVLPTLLFAFGSSCFFFFPLVWAGLDLLSLTSLLGLQVCAIPRKQWVINKHYGYTDCKAEETQLGYFNVLCDHLGAFVCVWDLRVRKAQAYRCNVFGWQMQILAHTWSYFFWIIQICLPLVSGVVQVVEHLPSNLKALSSIPQYCQKKLNFEMCSFLSCLYLLQN
jgi:hypothetical protein